LTLNFFLYSQNHPSYRININTRKSEGYYFLTASKANNTNRYASDYQMILDASGNLVYVSEFSRTTKTIDFKLQPNGMISFFSKNVFYLMNQKLEIIDSVCCKNGIITDHHEFQVLENGNYLLLGTEQVVVNLSAHKIFKPNNCAGSTAATVQCGVIQELDKNKKVVFEWHAKNHFKFREMDTAYSRDPKIVDWTHCNAVAQSNDGNILLSSRYFNEITKINRKDSSIIWRLGGYKNEFTFINDSVRFVGQHDIRQLPNGNITIFDNGQPSNPIHPATAKEYAIDEKNKTVKLVWHFINDSMVHSRVGLGNVQRLENGSTLVNYGNSTSKTMFTVVGPNKEKTFEITFDDTLKTYRAFFYDEKNLQLKRPVIRTRNAENERYLEAAQFGANYIWSTGEKIPRIKISKPGKYYLIQILDSGGYIYSDPVTISD